MPITITCGELAAARPVFEQLYARRSAVKHSNATVASLAATMRLGNRLKAINQAIEKYDRGRHALVIRHGRPVPGQKRRIGVSATYIDDAGQEVANPRWEAYIADHKALDDTEIVLDIEKIALSELDIAPQTLVCPHCSKDFPEVASTLSLKDLMSLSAFLVDETSPEG